jgi:pyridinium-3,5-bisthiocarboxylic acid mononucleotide nickel chelatase
VVVIAYVDAFSGCAGDMLLGALLDGGAPLDGLRDAVGRLPVSGFRLEVGAQPGSGPAGTRARVVLDDAPQPERRLDDVLDAIERAALEPRVASAARRVFERLARAEAAVHGLRLEDVHFHEVGAVDALVDVVGVAWAVSALEIERCYASPLPTGSGRVQSRHGTLPVPAPATLGLLSEVRAPLRPVQIEAELVTPTGAALLAELATFEQPPMRVERVGVGYGTRTLPWPNLLRVWLGRPLEVEQQLEPVVLVEANLDSMTPEHLGFAMERLFAAGALDVTFAPLQMKKNRPGTLLSALARPEDATRVAQAMLLDTTTLGVRLVNASRIVTERHVETVQTPYGAVRLKIKHLGERRIPAPEFEDCAARAREHRVPIAEVYRAALRAAQS